VALRRGSGRDLSVLASCNRAGKHREGTRCFLRLFDRSLALLLFFEGLPPELFLQLSDQHRALDVVEEDLAAVWACTVGRIKFAEDEPTAITNGRVGR